MKRVKIFDAVKTRDERESCFPHRTARGEVNRDR